MPEKSLSPAAPKKTSWCISMETAEKFMFDVSFDNEPEVPLELEVAPDVPVEEPEEEIIVPTFSEEELELARQQAFEEGKQEGLAATTETLTKQINETLALIDQKLVVAFQTQDAANEVMGRSALSVAKGICTKMLPALAEKHAFDEVERVITSVFAKLLEQPSTTITVHPSLKDHIEERINELSAGKGYEGKIILNAEQSMEPSDCKIEWFNGGSERDAQSIWHEISEIVERNLGTGTTQWNEPDENAETPAPIGETQAQADIETAPTETQDAPEETLSNDLQQPNTDD
jgi:flagellar assembly protein FliH